ncbi:DUF6456 domain-containing protein [Falsiruegeria litorea]|uniref:DUF6456 domain-containing protein n=1 Tax=Falsiruegeria litorea TaxID=1280831 RepID=UPI001BFDA626|nr:DUF6456 domain-containing protein [Falsiruegeria litorea]MBT8169891.1 hypothetical protein [Falsiruegeria litorea]
MSALAIPANFISDYFSNVSNGQSMREIAVPTGVQPSTVLRRIRRCEELRDHPEWDAIFAALEAVWETSDQFGPVTVTREFVAAALSLTLEEIRTDFAGVMHVLSRRGASIVAGDVPVCAVCAEGEQKTTLRRPVLLAALAFGWVKSACSGSRTVRKFEPTGAAIEAVPGAVVRDTSNGQIRHTGPYRYSFNPSPLEALLRRKGQNLITRDHVRFAEDFEAVYSTREGATADVFATLSRELPESGLTLLVEVCGNRTGLEDTERMLGLPARSAKAVLAFVLDSYARARGLS